MSQQQILDPNKRFKLACGKCLKTLFEVIVDGTGALCICQGCYTNYKLESVGGVIIQ